MTDLELMADLGFMTDLKLMADLGFMTDLKLMADSRNFVHLALSLGLPDESKHEEQAGSPRHFWSMRAQHWQANQHMRYCQYSR